MDHRKIAVRVAVMNEVQFLFPSEPRKPLAAGVALDPSFVEQKKIL